ncbi:uncharacterized protein LOC127839195 [Dreissena polymorpha]|uniref:uncharacterized protein LOC127839195 n=1 Tax=Dreissena polymorpha TaxID=45954 RepID=UPI0022645C68|nr:uncharacterized protein LOC127839195 [Dreissena polymorpha]
MTGSFKTTAPIQGTILYQPLDDRKLSRQLDYYAFGVVMRELLTGLDFHWKDDKQTPLPQLDIRTLGALLERRIWVVSDVLIALVEITRQCIESVHNRENMTSTSMRKYLKSILDKNASDQKWTNLGDNHCEICVINDQLEEPLKSEISSHRRIYDINHDNCAKKIKICFACMRNSYINPVRCQECDNEIKAIIGDGWGAILIVGYCGKNQALFQNDVKKFAEAISSKVLPSMCVRCIVRVRLKLAKMNAIQHD